MIEIPESLTLAQQLNETVEGREIVQAEAEHTKHSFAWYYGEPSAYAGIMEGQRIGGRTGLGSMVEIELSGHSLLLGDGTNIRYFPPGKKLPDRYQLRITLEDGSSLICTVQMYGTMFLVEPASFDNPYYLAAKSKPLPGTEAFDYEYFCSLREGLSGKTSVKEFLATHQRIPGLGNGVLQDILLEAALHPKQKISLLTEDQWKRTYEAVLSVLTQMMGAGGRDTEKTLFGEAGGYVTRLSKKTVGKPCPYCGSEIKKMSYLGGTVYFCPFCQAL